MGRPVVHFEIGCRDRETTGAFYTALFDWQAAPGPMSTELDTGSDEGISGHLTSLGHEPHNYINLYVEVDDLEAYAARATELGGQVMVPPTDIPGGKGRFAWITDPEGTVVGLFTPPA